MEGPEGSKVAGDPDWFPIYGEKIQAGTYAKFDSTPMEEPINTEGLLEVLDQNEILDEEELASLNSSSSSSLESASKEQDKYLKELEDQKKIVEDIDNKRAEEQNEKSKIEYQQYLIDAENEIKKQIEEVDPFWYHYCEEIQDYVATDKGYPCDWCNKSE